MRVIRQAVSPQAAVIGALPEAPPSAGQLTVKRPVAMVLVDNGSNSPEETTSTRYAPRHQRRSRLPSRRGRAPGTRGPNRNRPLCARRMEISSESNSAHFPGPLICRSRATGPAANVTSKETRVLPLDGVTVARAAAGVATSAATTAASRQLRSARQWGTGACSAPRAGRPPPLAVVAPAGCMRRRVRRTWAPTAERQSG